MDAGTVIGAMGTAAGVAGKVAGAISGAITTAGKIKEIADKKKDLELQELLIELRTKLLDAKDQCLTLREENDNLKAEVKRLSEPPELIVKNGLYYKKDGDGPFCTACQDSAKGLMRLQNIEGTIAFGNWRCPVCKQSYR